MTRILLALFFPLRICAYFNYLKDFVFINKRGQLDDDMVVLYVFLMSLVQDFLKSFHQCIYIVYILWKNWQSYFSVFSISSLIILILTVLVLPTLLVRCFIFKISLFSLHYILCGIYCYIFKFSNISFYSV